MSLPGVTVLCVYLISSADGPAEPGLRRAPAGRGGASMAYLTYGSLVTVSRKAPDPPAANRALRAGLAFSSGLLPRGSIPLARRRGK